MEELETRLQNFFSEPSEDKAKSLVPIVLKNQKSFENIITRMISRANYESLYHIADGCGMIAHYANKTIGVLSYVQKRMERLGEPKGSVEKEYQTLIELQFLLPKSKSKTSSPPQTYEKH